MKSIEGRERSPPSRIATVAAAVIENVAVSDVGHYEAIVLGVTTSRHAPRTLSAFPAPILDVHARQRAAIPLRAMLK